MFEKSIGYIHQIQCYLERLLLPFVCIFCQGPSERSQDLCEACLQDLPIVAQKCPQCARKWEQTLEGLRCASCIKNDPPFAATHSLFAYEGAVPTLIWGLKFQQKLAYGRLLGELLAEYLEKIYLPENRPQLLIPVPLHEERLKERGYNQAIEIARPLAKHFQLKMETRLITRVKNTSAQTGLSAEERHRNLKNAFHYEGNLAGERIALLDDVMTTGSTMTALSKALLAKGAGRIEVWCCARR